MAAENLNQHNDPQALVDLQSRVEGLFPLSVPELRKNPYADIAVYDLHDGLNSGVIRAAEQDAHGDWHVNPWVKQGILVGMRLGEIESFSKEDDALQFSDKDTLPLQAPDISRGIRIVPGGTSIRDGAHIGDGVIVMPPAYVNIGAYVGKGTMLDSHSLVGSCAQVGERCHISAGAQIGGVLEPVVASPCIVEDEVMMGINSSIAEGVVVKRRAVLVPGVNITSSTPVYDLVRGEIYRAKKDKPLTIPEGAVLMLGTRAITDNAFAQEHGLQIVVPVIKKYRDESTDAKTALEDALR